MSDHDTTTMLTAVLPLREAVVFPGTVMPLLVGRPKSRRLLESLVEQGEQRLVVVLTRDDVDEPGPEHLHRVGTLVRIVQLAGLPDGTYRLVVEGERRVAVDVFVELEPYLAAEVTPLEDRLLDETRAAGLAHELRSTCRAILDASPLLANVDVPDGTPGEIADQMASIIDMGLQERQALLEEPDVQARLERLVRLAAQQREIMEVGNRIHEQVAEELEQGQREVLLRRQLEAIRRELGEGDEAAEVDDLRRRLDEAGLPAEARAEADRELRRLEKLPAASPEHHVIRTFLDWMLRVPWTTLTEDSVEVPAARDVLDEDHHGLQDVKERILEYLAVRRLKGDLRGPILCLVGPPGVGKTSLGRSVARALGREFVRMSLGGVRDEAELRGHRRTYIGSMPGRIVQALVRAGTRNPVFMLDEIDKLGYDHRGDPSAALLEILDPEQNHDFRDHYLDVPIDLSQVLFIATANGQHTIPPPLLDRLELIEIPGYTIAEKIGIAEGFLLPKQVREHGLDSWQVAVARQAVERIISGYTREAGVRALDRALAKVVRRAALRVVEGGVATFEVGEERVPDLLGRERFRSALAEEFDEVGVAAGLAVTGTGGEVLFVEAALVPGTGKITTTGSLGEVMKESAQAAVTSVRSRAADLGVDPAVLSHSDIHLHVPEGAIPKDGPSAGITLATALASALTGRPSIRTVGMTGEITLRGKVLPIGGIRHKVLAAHRAGLRTVLLPEANAADLEDVPEEVTGDLDIRLVTSLDQVLETALGPAS